MGAPIDFYFDFSSPYGYFASAKIDALAKRYGRTVLWRPFLLGVVFKTTGNAPLTDQPLKGKYARRDFLRCAAYYGVPFKMPSTFPIATLAPARAVYWAQAIDRPKASLLAKALFHAYFAEDRDIADASVTGAAPARDPGGDRPRGVRLAVHHRRRGAILGRGSPGASGTLA